jgi:hypothetical protein
MIHAVSWGLCARASHYVGWDFVYIKDLSRMHVSALENLFSQKEKSTVAGKPYFTGTPRDCFDQYNEILRGPKKYFFFFHEFFFLPVGIGMMSMFLPIPGFIFIYMGYLCEFLSILSSYIPYYGNTLTWYIRTSWPYWSVTEGQKLTTTHIFHRKAIEKDLG